MGGAYDQARKMYNLTAPNLVRDLSRTRLRYPPEEFDFDHPRKSGAVRAEGNPPSEKPQTAEAAAAPKQDGAIFLSGAFTGMRQARFAHSASATSISKEEQSASFGSVDIATRPARDLCLNSSRTRPLPPAEASGAPTTPGQTSALSGTPMVHS
jgi:hypothetical protein